MGQQYYVIRRMPTPGSKAHDERQVRLEKKGKAGPTTAEVAEEIEAPQPIQRTQPVSKARAKKKPKGTK
jgi:YidC/Oxa1 family membrane protein insertase